MAAPPDKTVMDLNGRWLLVGMFKTAPNVHTDNVRQNKDLSGNTNELMVLQGVSWIMRKAISLADITICIKQHGSGSDAVVVLENIANFGLRGTTEIRTLDWVSASHKDPIWGQVSGRSRFVSASDAARDELVNSLFEQFTMEVQDVIYSEAEAQDGTWQSQMVSTFINYRYILLIVSSGVLS
jgi:hypothetical protein